MTKLHPDDFVGIAYHNGWITTEKLRQLAQPMLKNQYGQYLMKLADTKYFGEVEEN